MSDLRKHYGSAFSKTNQGMVCLFRLKETGFNLIVANCHLYFDARVDFVRFAQVVYLMERINGFINAAMPTLKAKPPIILCGDFNSDPHSSVMSALHNESLAYLSESEHAVHYNAVEERHRANHAEGRYQHIANNATFVSAFHYYHPIKPPTPQTRTSTHPSAT